ncbi:phosphate uptake regulator PhoU [Candidatus Woesearchaeota archaeon]|nr:phosphate uptake regulator PhoU [Candidatus Woesearchaeota archaeon]
MKRKVIQLAHKTLVVSLPSKWARDYGVKKGAELEVEERGQQIVFSTSKRTDSEGVQVDFSELDTEVIRRWVLASLHKSGYDEIEILYKDSSLINVIQETIKEMLIGFAVIEQSKNRCVIRIVAEEQEKEFETILRRAFLVTKNMGDGIYSYIEEGKLGALNELLALEKTNNQLTNFCERILNKKGYKNDKKTCFIYVIVWNLEKICDHYKDICKFLASSPKAKVSKPVLEMLKTANEYFNSYYELFYKFDINRLTELNKEKNAFRDKTSSLLRKSGYTDAVVLCSLNDFVTKTSDFSASFIALNMQD